MENSRFSRSVSDESSCSAATPEARFLSAAMPPAVSPILLRAAVTSGSDQESSSSPSLGTTTAPAAAATPMRLDAAAPTGGGRRRDLPTAAGSALPLRGMGDQLEPERRLKSDTAITTFLNENTIARVKQV